MDAVVGQGKHIYRVDENWSKMPISIEMKPASKGWVFWFDRSSEQPVDIIEGNDAFLCYRGMELYRFPHAIRTKDLVAIAQGATSTISACGSSRRSLTAVCRSTCTGDSSTSPRRSRSRISSSPSRSPSTTTRERSRGGRPTGSRCSRSRRPASR